MRKIFAAGPSFAVLYQQYAKRGRIDQNAQITSVDALVIDATAAPVWAVVRDLRSWPSWRPNVKMLAPATLAPGATFRWRLDGTPIKAVLAVVVPERELTWSGTAYGLIKAVDQIRLTPLPAGRTRVEIGESMAGPLLPLFYNAVKLRAGHQDFLTRLAAEVARRQGHVVVANPATRIDAH